jgi:hypothetical protein
MAVIDQAANRRYSTPRLRFLIAMVARRALQIANGSASYILVRPVVVLAARVLGPGPTRLRLVKLAHNLDHGATVIQLPRDDQGPAAQPTRRAA